MACLYYWFIYKISLEQRQIIEIHLIMITRTPNRIYQVKNFLSHQPDCNFPYKKKKKKKQSAIEMVVSFSGDMKRAVFFIPQI